MRASLSHFLIGLAALGFLSQCAGVGAQAPASAVPSATAMPLTRLSLIVTDRSHHWVDDLSRDAVEIIENNHPQTITLFSKDNRPISYALAIDNSGSFKPLLQDVVAAAKFVINRNAAQDETFIERFISSDKVETIQEFTSEKAELIDALDSLYVEGGQSAVIDGAYLAVKHVADRNSASGPERRHALVLLTDGEDRNSYYTETQLVQLIRANDVQVFVVGIIDLLDNRPSAAGVSPSEKAEMLLTTVARESGGRVFFPKNTKEVQQAIGEIVHDLHEQYIVGYQSTDSGNRDKFRKLAIKIRETPGSEKLTAVTRSGYFVNPPDLDDRSKKKRKKKSQ
jgi:Ca-activated chloride channel homolog